MNLRVYRLQDQRFILVPDCSQPSIACRRLHGPMRYCGELQVDDSRGDAHWRHVLGDIGLRTYAVIDTAAAVKLFGTDSAPFAEAGADDDQHPGSVASTG